MAANGSYNPSNDILTVTGDGLPHPVTSGTFPNANNPNEIATYTFSHAFTYRGGDNTQTSQSYPLGIVGIAANGVALFNPSAGDLGSPPVGFHWVATANFGMVNFGEDSCGGHPNENDQYHYHDGEFISCWKANQVMGAYNDYYGLSQYVGDNMRHPDGHSKILGLSFDGYPVYGPYGYNLPQDNTSPAVIMETGYQMNASIAVNRPAYGTTTANPPKGALMEDYEYNVDKPGRHLDVYNGRYCHTPEYPNGTFAYFVTIWNDETESKTYNVTTSNGKFFIDGVETPNLELIKGSTYRFTQHDTTNLTHPFRFSADSDGIHSGGTEYTTGVTTNNVPGNAGAWTEITVASDAPSTLYYYCTAHSGMGASSVITVRPNRYLTPKFPFIFGLSSKETLNIPANQGIGQAQDPGGGDGGGDPPAAPSILITNQPTNATIANGGTQTFSLIAVIEPEDGTKAYQWQVSTDGGFAWANITGANSASYSLIALAYMTGYRFRCIVTGPMGAPVQAQNSPLASNLVILTVTGGTGGTDTSNVLKWDSIVGRFDMTAVPFDRDNQNPDFTRNNVRFDLTNYEFDLT